MPAIVDKGCAFCSILIHVQNVVTQDADELRKLVEYHVVGEELSSSRLNLNAQLTTLNANKGIDLKTVNSVRLITIILIISTSTTRDKCIFIAVIYDANLCRNDCVNSLLVKITCRQVLQPGLKSGMFIIRIL